MPPAPTLPGGAAAAANGPLIPASTTAPAAPAAPTITLDDGTKLDSGVVKVMRAIRSVETSGVKTDIYQASGDNGTSLGAYQWNNGKTKLAQGQLPANFQSAAKQFGLDPTDFSPANQNKVAYAQISYFKNQGLTPNEIDAKWNGAKFDQATGTYSHVNPARLPLFQSALKTQMDASGGAPEYGDTASTVKQPAPIPTADQASAEQSGAWFPAATGDNPLMTGLKAAGNMLPSAFNFAKGAVSALNPINTLQNLAAIPGAFSAAVDANGGNVGTTLGRTAQALPGEAYQALVPKAARELVAGDLSGATRDITNDPFGTVAPFVFAAQGLAKGVDAVTGKMAAAENARATQTPDFVSDVGGNTVGTAGATRAAGEAMGTDFSGAMDRGISKVGGAVTAPIGYAFGKAGDIIGAGAKIATAKMTGLNESTIDAVKANPEAFTPEKIASASRTTLGEEVGTALNDRIDTLSETGRSYKGIRASAEPVKVDPKFLGDAIEKNTGLTMTKGKFVAGAKSAVDAPSDIAKVQRLYDAWQPYFKSGKMTADDILTFRSKLADIANFDTGFGKSKPLESAAAGIRQAINTEYRPSVAGLTEADATYASLAEELKTLRKGLIDKDGNLTDAAINRIANAAGKGKDAQLARLEEISPGITLKIRQLKAVEDIQNLHKVGTYTKSAIEGGGLIGGLATMNLPLIIGSITAIILTQPEVAVRMIRSYGKLSGTVAGGVLDALKKGGSAVNNSVNSPLAPVSVFGRPQQQLTPAQ